MLCEKVIVPVLSRPWTMRWHKEEGEALHVHFGGASSLMPHAGSKRESSSAHDGGSLKRRILLIAPGLSILVLGFASMLLATGSFGGNPADRETLGILGTSLVYGGIIVLWITAIITTGARSLRGGSTGDEKASLVLYLILAGISVAFLGLGTIPAWQGRFLVWTVRIALVSELGVLLVVLGLALAWKWRNET